MYKSISFKDYRIKNFQISSLINIKLQKKSKNEQIL